MNQSLISVGSNFEPTHNIRKAIEHLDLDSLSRVFITKGQEPQEGNFFNMSLLSRRTYSQEELRSIENEVGRDRLRVGLISVDLDLQLNGVRLDTLSSKKFLVSESFRNEWQRFSYVGIPTWDLFSELQLPERPAQLVVPEKQHIEWLKGILGAFDLINMPQIEGSLMHHEYFMDKVLDHLVKDWQPPDFPIAAGVVYNGEVITLGRSTPRSTQDSTAHAEMNVLREASMVLGRIKLRDAWLYSTHAPCCMCRETAFESGVRGIVWAIDPWEAPNLYSEKLTAAIDAFKEHPKTTFYREVGKKRAMEVCDQLAATLTASGRPKKEYKSEKIEIEVEPQELYDSVAEEYLDPELHPVSFAVAFEQRKLREQLAKLVDGKIIDIGCGSEVPPVAGKFHGIDLSRGMVEERKRKVPGEISEVGDACCIPVEDRYGSAIFAGLVMDHVDDLSSAASEFARVLKPKSPLWITLFTPDRLPKAVYESDQLHFRSKDNVVFRTAVNRWSRSDIEHEFGSYFSLKETQIIPLNIRGFELLVHKLELKE